MRLGLAGKVVLVTGASQGIGHATAEAFVAEGARVMLCSRRKEMLDSVAGELHTANPGCETGVVAADLTTSEGADKAVTSTVQHFGRIDVLVINHNLTNYETSFEDLSDEQFVDGLQAKPLGYARLCRRVIPIMKDQGQGVVIIVGGLAGKQSIGPPAQIDYSLGMFTDTALMGLSKSLADTLGPFGIRVLTVNPGPIRTPRSEDFIARGAAAGGRSVEAAMDARRSRVPLGRVGEPQEVADVIVFLVRRAQVS